MNNVFFEAQNSLMSFNNNEADKWLVLLEEMRDDLRRKEESKIMIDNLDKIWEMERELKAMKMKYNNHIHDCHRNGVLNTMQMMSMVDLVK